MVSGKVDYKNPFDDARRADSAGMTDINNKSEAFEGHCFEEIAVPHLGMGSIRVNALYNTSRTLILWSESSLWRETVHVEQRITPPSQSTHLYVPGLSKQPGHSVGSPDVFPRPSWRISSSRKTELWF